MSVKLVCKETMVACNKTGSLLYRKGKLYIADTNGKNAKFLAQIPTSGLHRLLSGFRLTERLLRLAPRAACSINTEDYLLSCGGSIYYVDTKKRELRKELSLRPGMNNPLTFAKQKAGTPEETVLCGEYFSNNDRQSVSIFRRKNGIWSRVYSFAAGQIYHIHGIVADDTKDWVYILTGDADNESGIWRTTDDFQSVVPLVRGGQQYRSCVAYPTEDGLIYATDTPREQNWIYQLKQKDGGWFVTPVYQMPGPCIYGTQRKDGWIFATSVEGDDTLPEFRYRFSGKLGAGVRDRNSHLMLCHPDGTVKEIAAFSKDILPMLLFQFGNCTFPDTPLDAPLLCTPLSVNRYDGKTVQIELGE